MNRESSRTLPLLLTVMLLACGNSAAQSPAVPCTESEGITPLCGFERPEDIEPIAGGARLLVSEYGALAGSLGGRLVIFDPADASRRIAYPPATLPAESAEPGWGDQHCPGPPGPAFAPHGIHHSPQGGSNVVLVVNHGDREAIEFFELVDAPEPERVALEWRGCVVAPDGIWMNDVAGLGNGSFAASHMVTRAAGEEALIAAEAQKSNTGWALTWQPQVGWNKVPGSDGGLPNGVEVSADGDVLYVNEYFGDKVTAIELGTGRKLWSAAVTAPDNSSWSEDGLLLVASHQEDLHHVLACNEHVERVCGLRYQIVAIRPSDGAKAVLFEGGGDQPMGAVTVAVEHGDDLYLGSFVGDRMARIKRPELPPFGPAAMTASP